MTKDLLLLFPLLVFFLAGGVCGALFVAPRLGWHRPAAAPAPVPCRWRHLEDTPDMLDVYATAVTGGLPALEADALDRAALVYGPDARLQVEAVRHLATLVSGKLSGQVTVRCLPGQGAVA
jgi:hypothetical protein